MIDNYSNSQRKDKLSCYVHLRKFGILKICDECGVVIILKCHELSELENPTSWMYCKRVALKRWWIPFDADQPNHKHDCRERPIDLRQGSGVV